MRTFLLGKNQKKSVCFIFLRHFSSKSKKQKKCFVVFIIIHQLPSIVHHQHLLLFFAKLHQHHHHHQFFPAIHHFCPSRWSLQNAQRYESTESALGSQRMNGRFLVVSSPSPLELSSPFGSFWARSRIKLFAPSHFSSSSVSSWIDSCFSRRRENDERRNSRTREENSRLSNWKNITKFCRFPLYKIWIRMEMEWLMKRPCWKWKWLQNIMKRKTKLN